MDYVIVHNDIDKYYIDLLVRWENIQNKISEYGAFDFSAKKNDRYVLAGEKLSVKEVKELKVIDTGCYPELYLKYPDVVINNSDIAVLTEEILEYIEDKTSVKWDFLSYFDKISYLDKKDELSAVNEAEAKLRYLKMFGERDLAKVPNDIYEKLLGIALYSKYEENDIFEKVFSDDRFAIPEKFKESYMPETDLVDKLQLIRDMEFIKYAFTEYTGILDEFTSVKRYYTDEIMEVLTEINPVLYTIDPEISMKEFKDIVEGWKSKGYPIDYMLIGYDNRERAGDALQLEMNKLADKLIKADFVATIPDENVISELSNSLAFLCEKIVAGIGNVPDVFATGESKKILEALQMVTKCEKSKNIAIDYLNKIIKAFDNGLYNKNVLKDIFSQWVETYSIEFKKCIKYLSMENIEFMSKYLSEKETEFLRNNN